MSNGIITLSVPVDNEKALSEAAKFFYNMSSASGGLGEHPPTPVAPAPEVPYHIQRRVKSVTPVPPTPVVPPPPVVPLPITTAPSATPELDSEGRPWDARIHSKGKTKMKSDGTWKPKKGVKPPFKEAIEAELMSSLNGGPVAAAVTPPPPPPVAVAAPELTTQTLASLMTLATTKWPDPSVSAAKMQQVCDAFKIQSIAFISQHQELWPSIASYIQGLA